jgi:glyoxylase-like metal-dependent hydrolase (beta-lactamase superfamily II)
LHGNLQTLSKNCQFCAANQGQRRSADPWDFGLCHCGALQTSPVSLRVHALNCGFLQPRLEGIRHRLSPWWPPEGVPCRCWLIETQSGLILVDTGIGLIDVAIPWRRLGPRWLALFETPKNPDATAVRQIRKLGFAISDVRHVIVTHLHSEHTGGLADFPDASVHLHSQAIEIVKSNARTSWRYRPQHWAHSPHWEPWHDGDISWFGMRGVQRIVGLREEILLVPLPGHDLGHAGVAVRTERGWWLHTGDARSPIRPHRALPDVLGISSDASLFGSSFTRRRLMSLAEHHGVRIVGSHDIADTHAADQDGG